MEYIFNHALTNDTSGQPDRTARRRPVSAFVPTQSYYAEKRDDDVGRPVLQHRPLAKGEHTQLSLAKQFDDPGMRPKVFVPETVNKVSYGLMSRDVEGAAPRPKDLPRKPRDTDPNRPAYVLPGSSSALPASTTTDSAPAPSASTTTTPPATGPSPAASRPSPFDVSDINHVSSVVERPQRLATRTAHLDTSDIEGSWPGWEPHYRAHVGRNLRDPGLDVRDISGVYGTGAGAVRRRVASARAAVGGGSSGQRYGGGGVGYESAQQAPMQQHQHQYGVYGQQPQYPQQYLQQPSYGNDTGYDVGHTEQPWPQPSEVPVEGPAGEVRPVLGAPPFATQLPGGNLAAVFGGAAGGGGSAAGAGEGGGIDRRVVQAADLPAATVGKTPPKDVSLRHAAKRAAADAQGALSAEAREVLGSIRPSREAVEAFWGACRKLDRETCGKLTPADFTNAMAHARLPQSAGVDAAAIGAIARGFQDGAGMVRYRDVARTLLCQAPAPSASRTAPRSLSMGASGGAGTRDRPASATNRPEAGGGAVGVGAPPTRPSSARPAFGDRGGGGGGAPRAPASSSVSSSPLAPGNGSRGYQPDVGAASGRRGVAWASDPPQVLGPPPSDPVPPTTPAGSAAGTGSATGVGMGAGRGPTASRPASAGAAASSSHGTISARFNIYGNDNRPPLSSASSTAQPTSPRDSPGQGHVSATPAHAAPPSASGTSQSQGQGQGPPWPPAPEPDALQKRAAVTIGQVTGVPPREPCDTVYYPFKAHAYWFGGNTGTTEAAEAAGGGATGGPGGGSGGGGGVRFHAAHAVPPSAAAALQEAAREYQPSADPTASIVGKGHHRQHFVGTGAPLGTDPGVAAAVAAKFRPPSAGAAPSSSRALASSASFSSAALNASTMDTLAPPPPLQPYEYEPGGSVGASLKGPAAELYGATRPPPAGPRRAAGARPASAPRVGAGGTASYSRGSDGPRVGRAALERYIVREDISAVRGLY